MAGATVKMTAPMTLARTTKSRVVTNQGGTKVVEEAVGEHGGGNRDQAAESVAPPVGAARRR